MVVKSFLPALLFVVLLGGQVLLVSELAHAGPCACGMPCPGPRCTCNCSCTPCAISNSLENFSSTNFQIRSVHSNPLFEGSSVQNDNGSGFRLIAVPQAFLKLKCQRLKEMLSWAGESQDGTSAFQQILLQ